MEQVIYNFDKEVNRNQTQCAKYDGLQKYFGVDDAFPMWVADMDFETPEFINDAIIKRAHHAVYGYGIVTDSLQQSVVNWMQNQHAWHIQKEWLTFLNGVVPAYSAALEAFSEVNDEIIVQTPVYFPLFQSIKHNKRKVIYNPLKEENGYYTMDLEDLKSKITPKTKILTLCSPHNPVGRIWSKEELEALAKICLKNNIIIISDEIHADITFKPFTPLASISEAIANMTITLNAAGKTFNIAGLNAAYAITRNEALKAKSDAVVKAREIGSINVFGTIAMEAAYTYGQEWVNELKEYLSKNISVTKELLKNTNIKVWQPEATYLLWLDFSCYDLTHSQIKERLLKEAKVALNDGLTFGKNGSKHFRLNIALPVTRLKKYLNIIAKTF